MWNGARLRVEYSSDPLNTPPNDFHLFGRHNRVNASLAMATARLFTIQDIAINKAIASASPEQHRGTILKLKKSVWVIDDCYNANPTSMEAALHALQDVLATRKHVRSAVAILGDMFELGDRQIEAHKKLGKIIYDLFVDEYGYPSIRLITIGSNAEHVAYPFSDYSHIFPEWTEDLPEQVADLLSPGDTVLLKASRGMRLERLIPAIERRFGPRKEE